MLLIQDGFAILNEIPFFVFLKDKESRYVFANNSIAHFLGLRSGNEIVGRTDFELPWKERQAEFYVDKDRRLFCEQTALSYVQPAKDQVLLGTKKLYFDKTSRKIYSFGCFQVLGHDFFPSQKILNLAFSGEMQQLFPEHKKVFAIFSGKFLQKLTRREAQCLLYLIVGKTQNETAQLLNLSERTVETYLTNVRYKLNCEGRSELVRLALKGRFLENFVLEAC